MVSSLFRGSLLCLIIIIILIIMIIELTDLYSHLLLTVVFLNEELALFQQPNLDQKHLTIWRFYQRHSGGCSSFALVTFAPT